MRLNDSREVRFGIVGCNTIAPWHASAIRDNDDARLVAVCDRVSEHAERLANEFGASRVYTDYDAMLADPDIDAVCICTPSGMHGRMGTAAARAGKHVLTEKPVGIRLSEIDEMIATGRSAGVRLGVVSQMRTLPVWKRIRNAVQNGKLGRMVLADAVMKYNRGQDYYDSGGWRGTWDLDGGGALMNQGVHCVDLLLWIMGPVRSVFGFADHLVRRIEVEDTAVATLRFADGAIGAIQAATSVTPGVEHRLEFHGALGTICVRGESILTWDIPGDERISNGERLGADIKLGSGASNPKAISTEGHRAQIADFVSAIREDRDPMVTGEDARRSIELILAVYRSSSTGAPVHLPLTQALCTARLGAKGSEGR